VSRAVLFGLLTVVAAAAAVLSFDALRTLALVCGFSPALAWLLPVTVDAGAAAGSLAWLSRAGRARSFGRALALLLLTSSVAGNGLAHALDAYDAVPPWALVVAVSAVAPAVLGAVVHLAVLVGRPQARALGVTGEIPQSRIDEHGDNPHVDGLDERGLSRLWDDAPAAGGAEVTDASPVDARAAELIAAGAGRRRLARELGLTEHGARRLLDDATRNGREAVDR
jgi:hypothetical protein